jgi:hypothetical protein
VGLRRFEKRAEAALAKGASQGGSGAGRDVGAIARCRFRQDEKAFAKAGDAALSNAGETGEQAVNAVREIFRRAYRASSLVECLNTVLRMQQVQHRQMTLDLLDLKRLSWNCHRFGTGRRRDTTPYDRLSIPCPQDLRWWEVLKLTPEQLRNKRSTMKDGLLR